MDNATSPETTGTTDEKVVTVYNRGTNTYQHGDFKLKPGSFIDVPESVAKTLCSCDEAGVPAVVLADTLKSPSSVNADAQKIAALAAQAAALEKARQDNSALAADLAAKDKELAGLKKLLEGLTAPSPTLAPATADVQVATPPGS